LSRPPARPPAPPAREAFLAFSPDTLAVEHNDGFFDVVTAADKEAEAVDKRVILTRVPASRILGDEEWLVGPGRHHLDHRSIDGTSNFASGLSIFAVSIAAYHAGETVCGVIYDPVRDELFMAADGALSVNGKPLKPVVRDRTDREVELLTNAPYEGDPIGREALDAFARLVGSFRAVRRLGSCALHLAYVAAGRAAISHETKFKAWDIAAGMQLVRAAGGRIFAWDAEGRPVADPFAEVEQVRRVVVSHGAFDYESSALAALEWRAAA
jgi:myo-inositol-1(or 4)-monophosphatase